MIVAVVIGVGVGVAAVVVAAFVVAVCLSSFALSLLLLAVGCRRYVVCCGFFVSASNFVFVGFLSLVVSLLFVFCWLFVL